MLLAVLASEKKHAQVIFESILLENKQHNFLSYSFRQGRSYVEARGYDRWKNSISVMTHELTFIELVVESQYLLKLQSGKTTKKYPFLSHLNALVRCHSRCHYIDAFSRAQLKCDKCVWRPGSARTSWEASVLPRPPGCNRGEGS